ncbi:hypothetical protein [Streptosporangium minutum]|uniref:hypothetical protein n=1 Tax=Streptosporangium minutum TaxID=569862 RepID=UPI0013FD725E|nr:hypothetical protein [Streptosporangium minutum]
MGVPGSLSRIQHDVAIMSPYQEDNVRRFGDYIYDLNAPLEDMEVHLHLGEEAAA